MLKKIGILSFGAILLLTPTTTFAKRNDALRTKNEINNKDIVDFETAYYHSGLIANTDKDKYGDEVWMWGNNEYGQLGYEGNDSYEPIKVEGLSGNIIDLELNQYSTGVSMDTDNNGIADEIWVWGGDDHYESGSNGSITPTKLDLKEGNIIDFEMSGYGNSGIILDTNYDGKGDEVWMWGLNFYGQLGVGWDSYREKPIKVENTWLRGNPIDLDLGFSHSGVIIDYNDDGLGDEVWMWGQNNYGQLGIGTNKDAHSPTKVTKLPEGIEYNYRNLELGYFFESGIIVNDVLYMWGNNDYHQLGYETEIGYSNIPHEMDNQPKGYLSQVSIGRGYTSIIVDEKLYMWGNNKSGQLGSGNYEDNYKPTPVKFLLDFNIEYVCSGNDTVGAIAKNNRGETTHNNGYTDKGDMLYLWGNNSYGQLGNGSNSILLQPNYVNLSNIPNAIDTATMRTFMIVIVWIIVLLLLIIAGYLIYKISFKKKNNI